MEMNQSAEPELSAVREAIDAMIANLEDAIQQRADANAEDERKIAALRADKQRLFGPKPSAGKARAPRAPQPEAKDPAAHGEGDVPEALRPYAKAVEGKTRSVSLASADMMTDVVEAFNRPASRKEIIAAFYERFPYDILQKIWADVDGAVSVALRRAVQRGTVIRVDRGEYAPASHTSTSETDRS